MLRQLTAPSIASKQWMIVKWTEENDLSVVPLTKAVKPLPTEIKPGVVGHVRFSGSKSYPAEILAVGTKDEMLKKEEEVLAEMEENDGVQAEMAEENVGGSDRGMRAEMSASRDVSATVNSIESTPVSRKRRIPSKANAAKSKRVKRGKNKKEKATKDETERSDIALMNELNTLYDLSVDADIENATNQESDENATNQESDENAANQESDENVANQESDEEPGDVTECVGEESYVIGANQLGPNLKTDNVLANSSELLANVLKPILNKLEVLEKKIGDMEKSTMVSVTDLHSKVDNILAKKRRHQMNNSGSTATPPTTPLAIPSPQAFSTPTQSPAELFPCDNGGCWLGNPVAAPSSKDRVWVAGNVQQEKISDATSATSSAKSLGLRLLTTFFSEEQLAAGNCTPAQGRQVLSQDVMSGICAHIQWKYPACSGEEEAKRWHKLLVGPLNSRCRTARGKTGRNA